jgi:hypothetical protein
MKDFYNEICKPLKKKIEEKYRRWKDLRCSSFGRINTVKVIILPKAIYIEIEKSTLKFIWKHKRP